MTIDTKYGSIIMRRILPTLLIISCSRGEAPSPPSTEKIIKEIVPTDTAEKEPETSSQTQKISIKEIGSIPFRKNHALLTLNGGLLSVGGHNDTVDLNEIKYLKDEYWVDIKWPETLQPRFDIAAASVGSEYLFFHGGVRLISVTKSKGDRLGNGAYVNIVTGDAITFSYLDNPNIPTPRSNHCAITSSDNKKVFVWGGENQGTALGDGSIYNTESNTWSYIPKSASTPPPRFGHACFRIDDNNILITGGDGQNSGPLSDSWVFNLEAGSWTEIKADQPPKRLSPCIGYDKLSKSLLYFGGSDPFDKNDGSIIDLENNTSTAASFKTALDAISMPVCASGDLVLDHGYEIENKGVFAILGDEKGINGDKSVKRRLVLYKDSESLEIDLSSVNTKIGNYYRWLNNSTLVFVNGTTSGNTPVESTILITIED